MMRHQRIGMPMHEVRLEHADQFHVLEVAGGAQDLESMLDGPAMLFLDRREVRRRPLHFCMGLAAASRLRRHPHRIYPERGPQVAVWIGQVSRVHEAVVLRNLRVGVGQASKEETAGHTRACDVCGYGDLVVCGRMESPAGLAALAAWLVDRQRRGFGVGGTGAAGLLIPGGAYARGDGRRTLSHELLLQVKIVASIMASPLGVAAPGCRCSGGCTPATVMAFRSVGT